MCNTVPEALIHLWEFPVKPWQRNHVDLAGPFLRSMFLIVVNVHSKWPEVLKMNRTTATHNVEILRTLFARNELAEHLISENGPKFVPEEFKSLRNKMEFVNQLHPLFTQGSAAQPSNLFKPARARFCKRFCRCMGNAQRVRMWICLIIILVFDLCALGLLALKENKLNSFN